MSSRYRIQIQCTRMCVMRCSTQLNRVSSRVSHATHHGIIFEQYCIASSVKCKVAQSLLYPGSDETPDSESQCPGTAGMLQLEPRRALVTPRHYCTSSCVSLGVGPEYFWTASVKLRQLCGRAGGRESTGGGQRAGRREGSSEGSGRGAVH